MLVKVLIDNYKSFDTKEELLAAHKEARAQFAEFVKIDAGIQTKTLSRSPLTFPARFRFSLDKSPIVEESCERNGSFH